MPYPLFKATEPVWRTSALELWFLLFQDLNKQTETKTNKHKGGLNSCFSYVSCCFSTPICSFCIVPCDKVESLLDYNMHAHTHTHGGIFMLLPKNSAMCFLNYLETLGIKIVVCHSLFS